jgi:hypothetical protein
MLAKGLKLIDSYSLERMMSNRIHAQNVNVQKPPPQLQFALPHHHQVWQRINPFGYAYAIPIAGQVMRRPPRLLQRAPFYFTALVFLVAAHRVATYRT